MRHANKNRKFSRVKKQREALLRSLAVSLVQRGRIKTTEAKAKELRPYIEKLVTKGKNDSLASRRNLISSLGEEIVVNKLIKDISTKHKDRPGGYTRIVKLSPRQKDGSKMALIEFV
jgi:large subunit ribosomal protein L17